MVTDGFGDNCTTDDGLAGPRLGLRSLYSAGYGLGGRQRGRNRDCGSEWECSAPSLLLNDGAKRYRGADRSRSSIEPCRCLRAVFT